MECKERGAYTYMIYISTSHKDKLNDSDLFSLHIFVRFKDLHGGTQNSSINIKNIKNKSVKQTKIKSIHKLFRLLVSKQHLRWCKWL